MSCTRWAACTPPACIQSDEDRLAAAAALATRRRAVDPANRSFTAFEKYQYRGGRPFVIAPSGFVRRHFAEDRRAR